MSHRGRQTRQPSTAHTAATTYRKPDPWGTGRRPMTPRQATESSGLRSRNALAAQLITKAAVVYSRVIQSVGFSLVMATMRAIGEPPVMRRHLGDRLVCCLSRERRSAANCAVLAWSVHG